MCLYRCIIRRLWVRDTAEPINNLPSHYMVRCLKILPSQSQASKCNNCSHVRPEDRSFLGGVVCNILTYISSINTWASGDSPLAQLVKELDLCLYLCIIRRLWVRDTAEPINNLPSHYMVRCLKILPSQSQASKCNNCSHVRPEDRSFLGGVVCNILTYISSINTWASGDSPLAQLVKELDLCLYLCVIRRL